MYTIMKEKASMNRTITLTDDERYTYQDYIDDHFELNTNSVICGDFNEINQQIPDKYCDLIILDPPYNITKVYGEHTFKSMNDDEYYEYILKIFKRCLRVLKDTGTMYVCGDWKTSYIQRKALEYCENNDLCGVINRITWSRDKGRGAKNNWKNNIEDIWMVVKSKDNYVFNVDAVKMRKTVLAPYKDKNGNNKDWQDDGDGAYRMTHPSNIWFDITVPFWSMSENTDHPTQKSEKLYAKLILASSNPGDVVYEPFAGVFSACVTAQKLNRNWFGVELENEYCLLGQKRLVYAEINNSIQGFEGGVFRDRY